MRNKGVFFQPIHYKTKMIWVLNKKILNYPAAHVVSHPNDFSV